MQSIFHAITSSPHLKMKFSIPGGIGEVRGNQQTTQTCYLRRAQPRPSITLNIDIFDFRDEETLQRASLVDELIYVPLSSENLTKTIQVGSLLLEDEK